MSLKGLYYKTLDPRHENKSFCSHLQHGYLVVKEQSSKKPAFSRKQNPNISIQTAMSRVISKNFRCRPSFLPTHCGTDTSRCEKKVCRGRHRTVSGPSIKHRYPNIILEPDRVKSYNSSPFRSKLKSQHPKRERNRPPHTHLRRFCRPTLTCESLPHTPLFGTFSTLLLANGMVSERF